MDDVAVGEHEPLGELRHGRLGEGQQAGEGVHPQGEGLGRAAQPRAGEAVEERVWSAKHAANKNNT